MRKTLQAVLGYGLALLLALPALAVEIPDTIEEAVVSSDSVAPLLVANRSIIVFRAVLLGETPEVRAARARAAINDVLQVGGELQVTLQPVRNSYLVLLDGRRAFMVTPKDVDPLQQDTVEQAAETAAGKLRQVVDETRESRNLSFMLKAIGYSVLATLIFVGLIRLIYFLRAKVLQVLPAVMQQKAEELRLGGAQVIDSRQLYPMVSRVLNLLRWLVMLLLAYEWLSFVLSRFPYTRPWGESLNTYLVDVASYLLESIVSAIPGLGVAIAIFFIARWVSSFSKRLLTRVAVPNSSVSWLNNETLPPTMRLTALAIWLFALAMAYPYLPGAGTEAFKGLSVLIGLMISLGASSVVGQAASGLILTYTHTLRPGEYVRIGDYEGTVTEMGMFTTRIRTGLGEVLTLPNSMITSSVTKNYSRAVQGMGYVVDTVVTIGYDTPWRQVEAMLIEAARRTQGIVAEPAPQVFQTALSDYYPEYRLVAQAILSQPRPRALLLSALHANIQDVFNEYGVQIMSPHYIMDPQHAKVVPEDQLYAAPARREGEV
ncbi:mechanosensitive ion channel family protein [Aquipseudomonas ullengensis]|uniref:Small-conductance mechanosensitive channel n=1 Tax=Aquipseudomonas ullengensis TaxID=2759166 RepID=A0A7W4QCK7_9GAMM|nr:mechanosensitive ion channel domain-containing protein [Pseudomonas ullengensis]MBB2495076.1 mechanosensitive ion channel [Pseudomonas ullengensis]